MPEIGTTKYIIFTILLIAIEVLYIMIARRKGIVDRQTGSPTGGGIIFTASLVLFPLFCKEINFYFIVSAISLATISFYDDIRPQPIYLRLLIQIFACLFLFLAWDILPPYLLTTMLVIVVAVGIINAYNFMDGIDGMTGLYSLSVLITLSTIYSKLNGFYPFINGEDEIIALIIATAVFLIFNLIPRIQCFCGDVGSTVMGLAMVYLIGNLIIATECWIWIMTLAVYGVDTVLTIFRRIILRENITKTHQKHAYQLLVNKLGVPQLVVALSYAIIQYFITDYICGLYFEETDILAPSISIIFELSVVYFAIVLLSKRK